MGKLKKNAPPMPKEFIGESSTDKDGRILRKWTKEEEEWCIDLRSQGYTQKAIAESVYRDFTQTSIKLKRLMKRVNKYNAKHVVEKYEINRKFIEYIKPNTILDAYCGVGSFYRTEYPNISTVTNDKDESISADYHLDSLVLLKQLQNERFDIVDLDPFGSAVECFDIAIKMASKGLVITLGEIGHKRWKRVDFVGKHYGINSLEEFTIENIINKITEIGKIHNKILKPYTYKEWKHIGRVWFEIEEENNL